MTSKKTADQSPDQLGKSAPAFTVQSTIGQITLAQCLGRAVVLYFYPKDNTPGCTTETENFRDLYNDFLQANCAIVGASRDSLKSHENFSNKLGLPFPLIADPDESLCALYQVMKLKNMYGKQVRGIERSTFLIDTKGNLARVWRGVKVPGHAQEVLEAARALA
jgi:peroxiredoxin Q/BCP